MEKKMQGGGYLFTFWLYFIIKTANHKLILKVET